MKQRDGKTDRTLLSGTAGNNRNLQRTVFRSHHGFRWRWPGPLFFLLFPYGIGIYAGWEVQPELTSLVPASFGFLAVAIFCHLKNDLLFFNISAVILFFLLGVLNAGLHRIPGEDSIRIIPEGSFLRATGHVEEVSLRKRQVNANRSLPWSRAKLIVHRATAAGRSEAVSGSLYVYTFDHWPSFRAGDRIWVEGLLSKMKPRGNPGGTSWDWYRIQNEAGGSLVVQNQGDWGAAEDMEGFCPGAFIQNLRYRLLTHLQNGHEPFSILPALLLGMRNSLSSELEQNFQKSGTIHFLAVSGLHVFFLLFFFFFLFRRLRVSPGTTRIALGFVLFGYLVLTGFRTSTIRATVMATVLLVAVQNHRSIHPFHLLGVAAWGILFVWPLELFSPGFQYSFLAVFSLILLSPLIPTPNTESGTTPEKRILREFLFTEKIKQFFYRVASYVLSISGATLVVLIFMGPLMVQHFHLISPAALLTNPVFFLLVPILLGAGALHLGFALLETTGIPGFQFFSSASAGVVHFLEGVLSRTSNFVTDLDLLHVYLPEPGWLLIFCYWFLVLALFCLKDRFKLSEKKLLLLFSTLLILVTGFGYRLVSSPATHPTVTVLDVGHGTCIVVEDGNGHTLVYDCGTRSFSDPGRWTASRALWHRGIRSIDLLVISHPDLDHISGIRSLVDRFQTDRIWISNYFQQFSEGRQLVNDIESKGQTIQTVSAGHRDRLGTFVLKVLSPPSIDNSGKFFSDGISSNGSSIVLSLRLNHSSILLTGDLEDDGKEWFRQTLRKPMEIDLLQIPHHGGAGSARNSLAGVLAPEIGIISAGNGRISPDVHRAYGRTGSVVLDTVRYGSIQVEWTPGGTATSCWKDGEWIPIISK